MSEPKSWSSVASLDDALNHGLTDQEFKTLCDLLGRPLSVLEVGICAALYSEHCSYKSTKVHLRTLPSTGERVIIGPGENAGVVDIGDGEAVVFKVESHNHPSFIEPFQGAATGVGGILRDVFTMGARPLALLNALRFGEPSNARTPYLLAHAVAGIGFYGNCIGVPTIGGELFFHESYNGNCLVNAFALGLVDRDKIYLGRAAGPGNTILYLGSKTGRDGIHGATMASAEFGDDAQEKRPTVQVGDPFQEKLLLEACLEIMQSSAVIGIQDMGAAGLTSSTYEMAARAETGIRLNLNLVPQRELAMNPYEIMLSESQERMLLVVEAGREQEILKIVAKWELDCVAIGQVVEGNTVDLFWQGECVSSLPVSVVTTAVPQYRWTETPPSDFEQRVRFDIAEVTPCEDLAAAWLALLGSPNCCSRHPVYAQYDSTVRTNTVIHPGGDAAVIRIKSARRRREKGIAITLDCNSRYCGIDPRQGTALSLAEACRNIAAVGGVPIGISDCLNFGSPERPEGMWQIAESIRGLGDAARAFGIPVISGNVSLYNETKGKGVLPTPMLAVVGLVDDVHRCVPAYFRSAGDVALLVGETRAEELGGSEYMAAIAKVERGMLPLLHYEREVAHASFVRELIAKGLVRSCHDVSQGGLAVALAESCFGAAMQKADGVPFGATLEPLGVPEGRVDGLLFGESGERYLISCTVEDEEKVRTLAKRMKVPLTWRGTVGGDKLSLKGIAQIGRDDAFKRWRDGLADLFGAKSESAGGEAQAPS